MFIICYYIILHHFHRFYSTLFCLNYIECFLFFIFLFFFFLINFVDFFHFEVMFIEGFIVYSNYFFDDLFCNSFFFFLILFV